MNIDRRTLLRFLAAAAGSNTARASGTSKLTPHVVPNLHPGCTGWLAPYHVERNYCLYAHLDHQDLALKDPDYRYVFSEIPHLITTLERRPDRFQELQQLEEDGKTEIGERFRNRADDLPFRWRGTGDARGRRSALVRAGHRAQAASLLDD